jgi:hypothetical protein
MRKTRRQGEGETRVMKPHGAAAVLISITVTQLVAPVPSPPSTGERGDAAQQDRMKNSSGLHQPRGDKEKVATFVRMRASHCHVTSKR